MVIIAIFLDLFFHLPPQKGFEADVGIMGSLHQQNLFTK